MRSWTLVLALALVAATLMVDTAMAGRRRCGGRRHRCGYAASPCVGGHCSVAVGPAAPASTADWTNGYPGIGYTGYGYTAFAGYPPGAMIYGASR